MVFRWGNFIERSVLDALSFLKESIFAHDYALKRGFLQSLDPRIKAVTFLLLIIQILLTRSTAVLLSLYVLCLLLTCLSGIHFGFFLKRTWIFIPLFSFFIAIPALFSIFTPGYALFSLDIMGLRLIITRQGLNTAVLFLLRVVTSVSFVILLGLTTKHFELLKVLRIFKIPQLLVMVLGMCYRYIYLFVELVENTYLGIKSRVGAKVHYKKGQAIVAWNIALLWQRSFKLNEEVYNAMLSRGYTGEPVLLGRFRVSLRDWIWLSFSMILCALLTYLNYGRPHF